MSESRTPRLEHPLSMPPAIILSPSRAFTFHPNDSARPKGKSRACNAFPLGSAGGQPGCFPPPEPLLPFVRRNVLCVPHEGRVCARRPVSRVSHHMADDFPVVISLPYTEEESPPGDASKTSVCLQTHLKTNSRVRLASHLRARAHSPRYPPRPALGPSAFAWPEHRAQRRKGRSLRRFSFLIVWPPFFT